jgi:M3 family oligoendopeptidase
MSANYRGLQHLASIGHFHAPTRLKNGHTGVQMHPAPRFPEMPYQRPELDQLNERSLSLLASWDAAVSADEQIAVIHEWNQGKKEIQSNQTLAMVHFQQDTTDPDNKAEQMYFDDLGPVILGHDMELIKRITQSAHRAELEEAIGKHAFNLWECFLGTFEPSIADYQREEANLCTEYSAILAGITVEFQGQTLNLSTLRGFFGNPDRETRRAAQMKRDEAMSAVADDLDRIYGQLVTVRHKMAQTLGYENFVPLGYGRMDRTDYGAKDVATFRDTVRNMVVPLAQKIYARRAEALGLEVIEFHDESVRDTAGVPRPKGDHDWMIGKATEMFDALGSDFSSFFRMMTDCDLLDLKARTGKAGGGFCADVPRYGVPFIFANFNGTQDDVNVFTHECGHAFQNWSSRDHSLLLYQWPTYEAAEIHSMSLEFLTFPYMDLFFGEDTERYKAGHLEDAILFLPYGCAVDEFQHRVYSNPEMSAAERAALWSEIEAIYLPHRSYTDMPHFESGRLWQQQHHIFAMPFYYIDYCLAQTCALQMWHSANQDREDTMERYRQLCSLGGTQPFTALLDAVGLSNPFLDGCLDGVCGAVVDALELE